MRAIIDVQYIYGVRETNRDRMGERKREICKDNKEKTTALWLNNTNQYRKHSKERRKNHYNAIIRTATKVNISSVSRGNYH